MRVLLTGAAGFLGSHCLRHLLVNTDWDVVCPVSFTHKGLPERITTQVDQDEWWDRVTVVKCDLSSRINDTTAARFGDIDYIVNYAAESHVDRSIVDPATFIRNNVDVAINLLDYARVAKPKVFIQISTDEVYGPAPEGYAHKEWDAVIPSNPYSASKAAQEAIATFRQRVDLAPGQILGYIHDALRKTRGAVAAIAEIRPREQALIYAGVGNISGVLLAGGSSRSLVSHNGTLGMSSPKIQEFRSPWPPDAMLVLHSDGLHSKWDLSSYAGLASRHPAVIGGALLRDFRRQRDDTSIVVVKAA